ncbi:MAG: phosphoribosylglycinamide synthetase C domain-containing protein, partial [Candidatus Wallbacteria bacterium]|nr:phosphoribosylglycinamide synthetase C domain-containing protein [Candidatus Wallbacteria bacterium]
IEEYLTGTSVSCFAFIHRNKVLGLTSAEDYKRAYDGDRGPNTGGMGAFSPSGKIDSGLLKIIETKIFKAVLEAMKKEDLLYSGVMVVNLIISGGQPKITEFNLRFNDPLTQVVLPRLKNDLIDVTMRILTDDIKGLKIEWDKRCCLNVVGVSEGYPLKYKTGFPIAGLDKVACSDDLHLFHAGTQWHNNHLVTGGGRVFDIAVLDRNVDKARNRVYDEIKKVCFSGIHYRKDIGLQG